MPAATNTEARSHVDPIPKEDELGDRRQVANRSILNYQKLPKVAAQAPRFSTQSAPSRPSVLTVLLFSPPGASAACGVRLRFGLDN
jgi:hypothetical protein